VSSFFLLTCCSVRHAGSLGGPFVVWAASAVGIESWFVNRVLLCSACRPSSSIALPKSCRMRDCWKTQGFLNTGLTGTAKDLVSSLVQSLQG